MKAEEFRSHFPIFSDGIHLCSCSEGALSDRVTAAMSEFMTSWRVHVAPWEYWMDQVDLARDGFARLIHANPEDIAVVSCASEGAFQVASAQNFESERRVIVTNDLEFPSIAHTWLAQQPRGANVRFVPHREGVVEVEDYQTALHADVALVSVPLVSYANGLRYPVKQIIKAAHLVGARVMVDAYQGAGVVPVDVNTLGCDYLVAGTLKYLLGAPGIAFLWVKPGLEHRHDPALTGWFARQEPFAFTPRVLDYAQSARRYQTGTPSIPSAFAAVAGLSLINETETEEVFSHVELLADMAQEMLQEDGWRFFSPIDRRLRGPQVTLYTDEADALSRFLSERRIFVSPRGNAIRISLHYYNNADDIVRLGHALRDYQRTHGKNHDVAKG